MYCPKCRKTEGKRDNEILKNISYEKAEEIAIAILRQAIVDLHAYQKRDKQKLNAQARNNNNRNLIEAKRYIVNGFHRNIMESDPHKIIRLLEKEGLKDGRR